MSNEEIAKGKQMISVFLIPEGWEFTDMFLTELANGERTLKDVENRIEEMIGIDNNKSRGATQ